MNLFVSLLFFSASLTAAPWARVAGGVYAEELFDLVVSPDGDRCTLGFTTSIPSVGMEGWLMAHDANGKLLWQKSLGLDNAEYMSAMALTSDGGRILIGRTLGENEKPDLWIVKLDAKYKIQWRRLIGGADWDSGRGLIQTADGGLPDCGPDRLLRPGFV